MKWDIAVSSNGEEYYSDSAGIATTEQGIKGYAYCLPGYSLLNGGFQNAPARIPSDGNGYISKQLSDANGVFGEKPTVTLTFDRLKTSSGMRIVFNKLSGDYASHLNMKWYKNDELVEDKDFMPTSADYFCSARVTLFNKIVITFNESSKAYRHIWLAFLQNHRLTDAGGLKIIYDDIALGAKENASYTVNDNGRLDDLRKTYEFPDVALALPKYSLLDGMSKNYEQLPPLGYLSKVVSDENGMFTVPPVLTATFSEKFSSIGITLKFNDHSEDYCSELSIAWFSDDKKIAEETFYPDSFQYFCYRPVEFWNKIQITFKKTSKPYRNVFLTDIRYGLERIFKDDEAKNVDCVMELSPISEEISINTLSFTVRSKTDYTFAFQKKQQVRLYFDEAILGIFYLKNGKKTSITDYEVETHDAVGLLDAASFMGGMYNGVPAKEVVADIFDGEDIPYFLDDSLENVPIYGYLPITTKRDALAQLSFAIGAAVNTAYDMSLYIYPQKTELSGAFDKSNTYSGLSIEHSEIVTGVRVSVHSYSKSDEVDELYNDVLNGTAEITFSEAHHSLSITGGVIIEHGDNYAIITGTGATALLTGKKYNHMTSIITKENPDIARNKNIVEVNDATLVTSHNAQAVLDRVYQYYSNNESVSCRVLLNTEELGDIVTVDTDFDGMRTGAIRKMDFTFTREMTAEVEIG